MVKDNQYEKSDFVDVVDENDVPLEAPVPKKWLGTDLLPQGTKKAGKSADKKTDPVKVPDGVPTSEWTHEQLDAYASAQDSKVDVSKASNKDEKLALLVKTPTTA